MFKSCIQNQEALIAEFAQCQNDESKYQKIIELGKAQPRLDPVYKIPENTVKGCQSTMYLHSYMDGEVVKFEAESDALISNGLAVLLIRVYSGETPEVILKCPPTYLEQLGIIGGLSPNRANGLYSIHLRMKQEALKFLMEKSKNNKM